MDEHKYLEAFNGELEESWLSKRSREKEQSLEGGTVKACVRDIQTQVKEWGNILWNVEGIGIFLIKKTTTTRKIKQNQLRKGVVVRC